MADRATETGAPGDQPVEPDSWATRRLSRRNLLRAVGLGTAGVAIGACGSSTSPGAGATGSTAAGSTASTFPIGAAAKSSSRPVGVTMWHSMTNANLTTLEQLAKTFNDSQHDVNVSLVNQNSYQDTLSLYTAALGSGNLPDLVQIESVDLQLMVDSQSVVPAADAVAADHFDLTPLLASTVEYFKVDGTLWALPFNVSSQVMYFDQKAFERAGLDPAAPPLTLESYRSYCDKIVSRRVGKYGTSLKLDSSNFGDWTAQGGGLFVNNENGRTSRATAVAFDDPLGRSLLEWFSSMLSSKLAQATPAVGGGAYDNLLAIPNGTAPMTIDTSAALGTVLGVLGGGRYPNVKLGVGPLPKPVAGPGGVPYGGAGLYMSNKSSAARQDGAWQFAKFLVSAPSQAVWTVGTGYIPINSDAVTSSLVSTAWTKTPEYRVAYEQLLNTVPSPATAGAVCGPLAQIGTDLNTALTAISNGTAYPTALAQAAAASNAAISSYNSRV